MRALGLAACVVVPLAIGSCSSAGTGSGFKDVDASDAASGTNDGGGGAMPVLDSSIDVSFGTGGDSSASCSPNPGNYDIPGNGCDDDGDGLVDNVTVCDSSLAINGPAGDFVKALGLCQTAGSATDAKWGVVTATYTNGHTSGGTPAAGQTGILTEFGNILRPREGASFGVLSSGFAREFDGDTLVACDPSAPNNPGCFQNPTFPMQGTNEIVGGAPLGFPKPAAGCPNNTKVFDVATMKVQIKVPLNAKGFQFDFDFWSGEWPEWVCTAYNDSFIAYLSSTAFNSGTPDNISFDAMLNPVSVNNGYFDRCTPGIVTACNGMGKMPTSVCPGGFTELEGTGFFALAQWCPQANPGNSSGGGATGWLTTQAPVAPGELITLELSIWDTGDYKYDSSVVLDDFQWAPVPVQTGTQRPTK